ncbi:MAG: hypothetical protein MI757_12880 [Pirellulales bacterium]|nr:hypothetical protein [Pirellulales bacterium]
MASTKRQQAAMLAACIFACAALATCLRAEPNAKHPLAKFGYGAEANEVRRCLAQFIPSEQRQREIKQLIQALSDPKFSVREDAHMRLAQFVMLPRAELRRAAEGGDSEAKARVEQILAHRKEDQGDKIWHDALRQIIQLKLKGLAPELLAAAAESDRESFWALLEEALLVTSTEADAKVLVTSLTAPRADVRAAAAKALVSVQGARAADAIKVQLDDKDRRVALATAKALATLGDRDCLRVFVQELESEKIGLRLGAVQMLRAFTGQNFGFRSTDNSYKRAKAVAAWRAWIEGEGKAAELKPVSSS